MPVREVLARHTSREIAEWMAYEQYAGPIDRGYDREALAGIHEQLQYMNRLIGAAHFTDSKHPNNPVPDKQIALPITTGELWIPLRKEYDAGDGTGRCTITTSAQDANIKVAVVRMG